MRYWTTLRPSLHSRIFTPVQSLSFLSALSSTLPCNGCDLECALDSGGCQASLSAEPPMGRCITRSGWQLLGGATCDRTSTSLDHTPVFTPPAPWNGFLSLRWGDAGSVSIDPTFFKPQTRDGDGGLWVIVDDCGVVKNAQMILPPGAASWWRMGELTQPGAKASMLLSIYVNAHCLRSSFLREVGKDALTRSKTVFQLPPAALAEIPLLTQRLQVMLLLAWVCGRSLPSSGACWLVYRAQIYESSGDRMRATSIDLLGI